MKIFIIILAGLATLGPFTTDTYFPFFPDMESHFGISQVIAQQSLSIYLLTFTVMMLFHGALSDSFGRRPVILVSLIGFVLTSIGCALTDSFALLLIFRAGQGFFVGAGTVVGQAIIRDRFDGIEAQKLISQVTMLFGLAPAIAPLVGGWLHQYFPWQSAFVFLALLGVVLLILCYLKLPESLPKSAQLPFHPGLLVKNYISVISHVQFMALASCIGFGFGGFLIYVAGAPDFVFRVLHLTELQFGWLFIPIVIGLITGSAIATKLAGLIPTHAMIRASYILMGLAAVSNLVYCEFSVPAIPWAVLPIIFYTLGITLLLPGAMTLALDIFPEKRGMASSIQGFMQSIIFTLISALIIPLVLGSATSYALAMMLMYCLNLLAWLIYKQLNMDR
jgi:MFS transporter, DHA1 family, multidrug resistance protein